MMYAQEVADHLHTLCTDAPAVYVGTYGKYNAGFITGEWIDLSTFDDYDEFVKICRLLHADEADPELMLQDYENFPRKFYSEWIDEDDFWNIRDYADMDDQMKEDYDTYCDNEDDKITPYEFKNSIDVCRFGSYADYAKQIYEDSVQLPSWLEEYFDWEKAGKDMLDDDSETTVVEEPGGIVIFSKK